LRGSIDFLFEHKGLIYLLDWKSNLLSDYHLETLEKEVMDAAKKIYDSKRLMQLMLRTLKTTKDPKTALWAFSANAHYHNMVFETDIKKHIKLDTVFGKSNITKS